MNNKHLQKALSAGTLSLIPGISSLQTAWDTYFQSQSEERHQQVEKEFLERLNNADEKLQQAFEKINENPTNFAIFLQSIKSAHEDISSDKIKMYINLLLNAVKAENKNDCIIQFYLNKLQKYSLLHLKLLQCFSTFHKTNSPGYGMNLYESDMDIIMNEFRKIDPYFNIDFHLLNAHISDLYNDKMINIQYLSDFHMPFKEIPKKTTSLGDDFLNFISE